MKILVALAWLVLLGSLCAQTQSQAQQPREQPVSAAKSAPAAPASRQPKIDPGKAADIRRLLDLTGAGALATQTMDGMEKNIKPLLTSSFPTRRVSREGDRSLFCEIPFQTRPTTAPGLGNSAL